MAPTVTVKPAGKPAAGATPPAADSNANPNPTADPPETDADPGAGDPPETTTAPEAKPDTRTSDEKKRAAHAKAEGDGHLVVVAKKTRFRCPQTGIQFPEGQKVLLKKPEMVSKDYNWIKSQIEAGVLTVVQETDSDDAVPDMR
jgi:hypothetical protein